MKIYLVRHGESTGDIEDRYGGWYDDSLTDRGREQLRQTAKQLVGKEIEAIYASPFLRAKEAAEIINSSLNVPLVFEDGLKERNYGILGGMIKKEAKEKYPEVVKLHENPHNTDPEGESYEDFHKRVIDAFSKIINTHHKVVAIVTHGGPIKWILEYLNRPITRSLSDGEVVEVTI